MFVGHPTVTGGGEAAGWYPVLDGAQVQPGQLLGFTRYVQHYTAVLKKLPNATQIRPGQVSATASILVKVQ
jgi:type 1 fimbria pilin